MINSPNFLFVFQGLQFGAGKGGGDGRSLMWLVPIWPPLSHVGPVWDSRDSSNPKGVLVGGSFLHRNEATSLARPSSLTFTPGHPGMHLL